MTKKTPLIITAAIIGSLALTSLAPAAYAFGSSGGPNAQGQNAQGPGKQMQQMFNQMHKRSHAQEQGQRGKRGGAGFIGVVCNDKAPEKLETRFDRIGKALDLSSEQEALLDDLKMASLTAQTGFLDVCVKPERDKELGLVEKIKAKNTNMGAMVEASNSTLPQLEAFINSLSDEQKAKLKKSKGKRSGPNMGAANNN